MIRLVCSMVVLQMLLVLAGPAALADDWPQFRGPGGQGHAPQRGLPLSWSETENIAWKVPLPGLGWSSPVIQADQIWLTTALGEGLSLRAICVSRRDGSILHNVEVFQRDEPGRIHKKNSHASPTPLIEGNRVYVHFGAYGTACLSTDGEIVWRKTDLEFDHRHGPGGSPVLYGDLLIFSCDGYDVQFVVALDKNTGEIRWKVDRPSRHAYSTPLVVNVDGKDQLVSTGGDAVVAYEPSTGEEIWRCTYDGYSLVPRPVTGHGMVFVCTGFNTPFVYGLKLGGQGDVTDTHLVWKLERGAPLNPSPLLVGDELYVVSDRGIATCLDARSGEEHWQQRLGGNYSASLLYADGRIYFLDEDGLSTVIAPGKEYRELSTNQVEGRTLASLAVAGKAFFLRSDTHLYRIEQKAGGQND